LKSYLRFHLGAWTSSAPAPEAGGLRWVRDAGAEAAAGTVFVETPLGALVDYEGR
jgi:hypothetical protein